MEPREVQSPAGGLQVQQPQQMLMGHTSSSYPSNSGLISSNPTANNIPPSSTPCFPFNSLSSPVPLQRHHQQQQQQQQQQPKPLDSLNSVGFDGSPQFRYNTEPAAMKKKRGRPRKYAPDGNIALLQLAPTTPIASNSANHGDGDSVGLGSNSGVAGGGAVSEPPAKRNRGRPPGSSKRQMDALAGGVGGVGFTPHVITVEAGEDIASKVMAFSQQGPRTVCILSANGAISNVTLRQPAMSGGTVTYE
ncbi:hypothetical protein Goarm_023357, partial [Gossypium armourianum]|nr:hypothetical protein [Gossypium armourianum]